ncbi:MAG TPA: hypothetical protein DCZ94_06840 [Lentisphaeria bacterium]|nr:MAG: hypothetical protein A2X48_10550 [Lentisphaerae bacterium GWF2_49_21]HBC86652.1 hypothetical protein [Lentisphaeria bacterium]
MKSEFTNYFVGILTGIVIASIGWHIYRAYETSRLIAQRDSTPVIVLMNLQDTCQKVIKEIEKNTPESNKNAKRISLLTVKSFIQEYENFKIKHPNPAKNMQEFYLEAKEFLKKHEDMSKPELSATPNGETP